MNARQVTATGDITTADAILRAVVLSPGSETATAVVRAGGSDGTAILALSAAASGNSTVISGLSVPCADGIHVTLTGTGASASVAYD